MARWDKLESETAKAYSAFRTYMLLPARERSIDTAWRQSTVSPQTVTGKRAPPAWKQWSVAHEWVERASAYDQHVAKQDELLWEQRRRQLQQRDWEQGDALRQVVDEALPHANQFIRRKTAYVKGTNGAPDREIITVEFDITGLATVLEKASKLQRLATGDATDNLNLSGAALETILAREFARVVNGGQASSTAEVDGDADAGESGEL